jgi:hypothetical protein
MATSCSNELLPFIQGYYVHCHESTNDQQCIQNIKAQHECIIYSLKTSVRLKIIVIKLSWHVPSSQYAALKTKWSIQAWQLHQLEQVNKVCT